MNLQIFTFFSFPPTFLRSVVRILEFVDKRLKVFDPVSPPPLFFHSVAAVSFCLLFFQFKNVIP